MSFFGSVQESLSFIRDKMNQLPYQLKLREAVRFWLEEEKGYRIQRISSVNWRLTDNECTAYMWFLREDDDVSLCYIATKFDSIEKANQFLLEELNLKFKLELNSRKLQSVILRRI